jgi:hypothetical protein
MSVGLAVTKAEIDSRAGDCARSFQRVFLQVSLLKLYLDATPDSDLITMGYTQTEVTNLKTAVNDLNQFSTIWNGTANLSVAKDFKVFVSRIWGLGAF